MLMLISISGTRKQWLASACSLYVYTTISMKRSNHTYKRDDQTPDTGRFYNQPHKGSDIF